MTLLLLCTLAPVAAADCPDPVGIATAVVTCADSIVGPDGENERIRNVWVNVDVVDQNPECLN